jgi:hypothetical protein
MFLDIIHRPVLIQNTVLFIFQNTRFRRPSDQSTPLGHLSHPESSLTAEVKKKLQFHYSIDWMGKLFLLCWYHKENSVSAVMISILIVLWCKTS